MGGINNFTVMISSTDAMSTGTTNIPDAYEKPFTSGDIAVVNSIVLIMAVMGIMGNTITVAVILHYRILRKNIFMKFIASLCISDLLSALISWIHMYRRTWGFDNFAPVPNFFCRFYWGADLMTSYATALHIFTFSIFRFISLKSPVYFRKLRKKTVYIVLSVIWSVCFGCGFIPWYYITEASIPDRNSDLPNARWPACTISPTEQKLNIYQLLQYITFPLFIYIPVIGVICTGVLIGIVVTQARMTKKSEKEKRKEKNALLQLFSIAACFLFGYIPWSVYEIWSYGQYPNTRYYQLVDYWFGFSSYIILRFSECLNPIFYNIGSPKMRKHTRMLLRKILRLPEGSANAESSFASTGDQLGRSRQSNATVYAITSPVHVVDNRTNEREI